jgi:hypothetical protein
MRRLNANTYSFLVSFHQGKRITTYNHIEPQELGYFLPDHLQ